MAQIQFIQAQPFALAGSGASIGDTTIVLQSMVGIDSSNIVTGDLGSVAFGTLEPGNGSQEEAFSFTGVTQNANGTATLTGVKTVLFKSPYTGTSGLAKTHAGASKVILSNDAAFYGNILSYVNTAIASGGVPSAVGVMGLVTLSTGSATPATPVVVETSDSRLPSANPTTLFASLVSGATVRTYDVSASPATWLKPSNLKYINIEAWGSGGSGGSFTASAGGGGGGAYNYRNDIFASSLASAVIVTIASGGAAATGAVGNAGGTSSFGTFLSVYGGAGAQTNPGVGGGGGGISGVATLASGGAPGGSVTVGGFSNFGGGGGGSGESVYGGGGGGSGGAGANSYYGGGGGGGGNNSANLGGTSIRGGNGGTGGDASHAVTAGSVPAGGGGGSNATGTASGAGAAGRVIVYEFYT